MAGMLIARRPKRIGTAAIMPLAFLAEMGLFAVQIGRSNIKGNLHNYRINLLWTGDAGASNICWLRA
jgi:hypothetical protein